MPNNIICPNCNCDRWEKKTTSSLELINDVFVFGATMDGTIAHIYYECPQCGYQIREPDDIALKTVKVYITGNSLPRIRRHLNKISELRETDKMGTTAIDTLYAQKYLQHSSLPGDWIFTEKGWAEHQSAPKFELSGENHKIEEIHID